MWRLLASILIYTHHFAYGWFPHPGRLHKNALRNNNHRAESSDPGKPLLLTPYIEAHQLAEARRAAHVDPQDLLPGVESYAGYFTVNKEYNSNLFFWYFPVAGKKVEETPWIIWLQGGPGASSMYGLFEEIGPFAFNENNTMEVMKYSWGKNYSLLFIDNPVGTGFSFTDDDRGYATNQTTIAENLYAALQQFLTVFPELRRAPLTVAGESYAGKHIPSFAIQIHRHKQQDQPINLYGLAIGNGFIDPLTVTGYGKFLRQVGMVDDDGADNLTKLEGEVTRLIKKGDMLEATQVNGLLFQVMFEDYHVPSYYNYLDDDDESNKKYYYATFLQQEKIRRALHVGSTNFSTINEYVHSKLEADFMNSAKTWLEELLEHYKVMLYNGHLDICVTYSISVNTYKALKFSGADEYKNFERQPWYHDGVLAGYYKEGGHLVEVMVRGAGHMVPLYKPGPALGLISAFVQGSGLHRDTGNLIPA